MVIQGVVAALMASGLEVYEIINLGNHRAEELTRVISILDDELKIKAEQQMLPIQAGDVSGILIITGWRVDKSG